MPLAASISRTRPSAAGRGHGRAVGRAGDRIDGRLRHFELPCLLSAVGLIAADLAAAVEAAGGEEPRAVGVEPDVIDAAGHGFVFANLVRVAAAGRRRLDVHLEEFRRAVGPAHENFVPLGMPIDGLHAAAEDARRVRRQIADESLRGHIGHLDRHVAAGRKQRLAVGGKHGAANPVIVGRHVHDLLEGLGIERPQGVIGPADGDQLAVGRPTAAVRAYRSRSTLDPSSLWRSNVPDLDLAVAAGIAAGDEQLRAVAGETHGFDAVRHAHQPRHAGRTVGLPKNRFVKAGHGEQLAVRREIERRDHRAARIDGRMIGVESRPRAARAVVFGALGDPAADEIDIAGGQRRAALRHLGLAVVRRDQLQQMALLRLAGNNRRRSAFAAAKKTLPGGHLVVALGFGRLMAAIAIGLQQRLDLFAIADLAAGLARFGKRRRPVAVEGDRRNREDCDQNQEPLS